MEGRNNCSMKREKLINSNRQYQISKGKDSEGIQWEVKTEAGFLRMRKFSVRKFNFIEMLNLRRYKLR